MELRVDRVIPMLRRSGAAARYNLFHVHRKLLCEVRLEQVSDASPTIPVTYRFGELSDLERLSAERHDYDAAARRLARERLRSGDQLVLGESHGEVIFSGWVMLGAIECGTRRILRISPRRAYSYKLHTVAAHRGARVMAGFYRFIEPTLLASGCRSIVCWIAESNAASLVAHRRIGFVAVAKAHELRLGSWTRCWISRALYRKLTDV